MLKKAVAAGYSTSQRLAHMTRDSDLDALRDRADFRRLLAELLTRVPRRPIHAVKPRVGQSSSHQHKIKSCK